MNLADGTTSAVRRLAKTFGTAARPNLHVRWLGRTEFAQALALIPGFSRSGATMGGGLLVGLAFAPTEADVHGNTPASGGVVLGPMSERGPTGTRSLRVDFRDWQGVGGVHVQNAGQQARLTYFVSNDADSRFRLRQPHRHLGPDRSGPGTARAWLDCAGRALRGSDFRLARERPGPDRPRRRRGDRCRGHRVFG